MIKIKKNYPLVFIISLIIIKPIGLSGKKTIKTNGKTSKEIHVPPPPFSEGIFPCSECHSDMTVNRKVRVLEDEHGDIKIEHGKKWCFNCHNPGNRNYLRLADGKLIGFNESYKLCGQCHGPKLRDWRNGIHGKRVGMWNGEKKYLLCAHCHNPHSPKFKKIKPLPPPVRPENIKR